MITIDTILHNPRDLVGIIGLAVLLLVLFIWDRKENRKKFRHREEYGSARWGNHKDTIDALNAIAKRVEAAIFIFSEDDKIWNEKSGLGETATVRDNVLFEYGLFMGAKGKNNVCIVQKGKTKSISDLQGITYIDAEKGEMHTRNKLKDWLGNIK